MAAQTLRILPNFAAIRAFPYRIEGIPYMATATT
jgi:hypothetical protein